MPALGPSLGAQLAGQAVGIAEGCGDLGLGATGGDAVVEVGLVIRDDLCGSRRRQADEAGFQAAKKFLTGDAGSP